MPITEHLALGSASCDRYDNVYELLYHIPDNYYNLIDAQDVRDSVYTLYRDFEDLQAATPSYVLYTNPTPVPVTIGGIDAGTTFSSANMQQMWDMLLYPYIAESVSLSSVPSLREYGDPSGYSITLYWSVTKNTDPIISITVDGVGITPSGGSQASTQLAVGTHSSVSVPASETNTYLMSASDGTTTANTSTSLVWMSKIYWGSIDLSGIGNPNLTTNPGASASVAGVCTPNEIINLTGAGVGSGDELATSKNKTYSGINGGGEYLIFAWPSIFSGAYIPTFTVNGLPNTAFTNVRTNSPQYNDFGFTTKYEVWISNTAQNSPLNIIIS